jgi:elongation factor P
MSMLEYNEIKQKKIIVFEGEPHEVLSSHVFRKQQRKPVNQTKLKNLMSGKVTEYSFHQSETAEEADIVKRTATYLYNHRGEWWFADPKNPKDRFTVSEEILGTRQNFLIPNTSVELLTFDDTIIGVSIPIKMTFTVTDAPPSIKGSTATGSNKVVTIETGATINTPMFVNAGDRIIVNTETGEYAERA